MDVLRLRMSARRVAPSSLEGLPARTTLLRVAQLTIPAPTPGLQTTQLAAPGSWRVCVCVCVCACVCVCVCVRARTIACYHDSLQSTNHAIPIVQISRQTSDILVSRANLINCCFDHPILFICAPDASRNSSSHGLKCRLVFPSRSALPLSQRRPSGIWPAVPRATR